MINLIDAELFKISDKIIVLNNGEIEAEGTHKELLGKSETYAKMWKSHISLSNDRGE